MIAWVIGAGGLLGSALCRNLRDQGIDLFSPAARFQWDNETKLAEQFAAAVQAFSARVRCADRWEIYWAAGVGNMGSSSEELNLETRVLSLLCGRISCEAELSTTPGAIAFASTAGAIYAGSPDYIISENTAPAPTTAYAREKLKQESVLREFAAGSHSMNALLARFTTIYGPGQSIGKQQGLLAHMARCMLRNRPIQIFVPFDTIRDYIYCDDAAAAMIATLREAVSVSNVKVRIVASERPTTVAEIISIFRKMVRRAPRIVTSASRLSSAYKLRVLFRSSSGLDCSIAQKTTLLIGIGKLYAAEHRAFVQSEDAGIS